MTTIYNYHQETGIFVGIDVADPSPLEPGVFLVPAYATTEAPPACGDGQHQVFRDGGWVVEDIPQPAPVPVLTADEVKASMWSRIKAERDRRIQSGGYKVGSKWFHSDTFSRTQQMGLVMLGASIPANTPWKTMDGSTVTMTQALAGQIFAAAATSDIAIFAAAEAHKAAMEAIPDPASYDFSAGWPATFAG
jgi:hypothetical protein